MSVFRQCGKGGFVYHVCSEGFPCPYLEGVLMASSDWSSQASVIMASGFFVVLCKTTRMMIITATIISSVRAGRRVWGIKGQLTKRITSIQ